MANISGGKYRYWWRDADDRPVFSWNPQRTGHYRIWLSWAAAPHHTLDASYFLDVDGNLETTDDRVVLARIDQRHLAPGAVDEPASPPTEESQGAPPARWSGFYDGGAHQLHQESKIVLYSGVSGSASTS